MAAIACFLLAAFLVLGCGSKESQAPVAPKKPRIALIMKSLANEFFMTMEKGARELHATHADQFDLVVNGTKDESDMGRQTELVDQMIAQRVDAIVIAPADSKALVAVCKKAQDAGIVVVNIDNKLDDAVLKDKGVRIPFVGPDNRKAARAVGEYLAKNLSPGAPVAIVEGVPTAFNAQQRKLGFEDAMNAAGMKIVTSQSAGWEMDKANQVVAAMITEHPDLRAVLCANDSMALGAVSALKAANKSDAVLVVGFDNISAVHDLVKEGKIVATADQLADQLASFGIEYALEMLAKKGTPADRETPVALITKETIK
jgi:ribose transport system substrate-binding protein